jgi:inhibitor of cysteine peptidase
MEKKIKRQAVFYGLAAILLATVLGALIYDYRIFLPEFLTGASPIPAAHAEFLSTFSSSDEIKNFLASNSATQGWFPLYGSTDATLFGSVPGLQSFVKGASISASEEGSAFAYSSTNVQVAGVDELDTVKVDDEGYMYVLSGNVVSILRAYPSAVAGVVSTIDFEDAYPIGVFVKGDRLAVFSCEYILSSKVYYSYYYADCKTSLRIYDIHARENPFLLRDLTFTGSYFDSRMIGDYIYFVVNKQAYVLNDTVVLPEITSNGKTAHIEPSDIHYINGNDTYYQYTTFVAVNMQNTGEAPVYLTIMLGSTSNMYVSLNNMYVTFQEWSNYSTTIYRIRIQANNMTCEAKGSVLGYEINQFSMDEYGDYFRIVTTDWTNGTQQNNLYVLNMSLSVVGKLENLATGENLHSTRFMGNRAYLVTFKNIDPLFVINLTNPAQPSVLGQLKIPGYSDYLHPYDETHLIGVGKETVEAGPYFAWYQGIKIALFDVSNVTNPIQMYEYVIGDRGSNSPILTDHKAFLFDKTKNLLVIPVLVAKIDESQYPEGVPANAYGQAVWQGAYVFGLSLEHGFNLTGKITHIEGSVDVSDTNYWVERSLYIENVLYTVSERKVMLNSLEDLSFIKEISLS